VPAVVELLCRADDTRLLTPESLRHEWRTRPERARALDLVAEEGGRVVACGHAGLNTWTSDAGASWAFVTVADERRGEGIGSAVGDALLAHLASIDARKATTFIRHTEEGERWAQRRGWSRVITGPLIALDPRVVPEPEPPAGFRCVPMSELTPHDLYDAVCETALDEPSATPNDAIDLDEFVREWNDPIFDRTASAAVVHDGKVVAFSFMRVAGARAQHGFTGCLRAYRGRGLATAAKRYALRAAAARGVTRVTTSNAEENAAMRAINRKLGFEPIGEHLILARELG
jgi:RimJ/RimL family protein N-acetyltransferase